VTAHQRRGTREVEVEVEEEVAEKEPGKPAENFSSVQHTARGGQACS